MLRRLTQEAALSAPRDPVDQVPHTLRLIPLAIQDVLVMYAGAVAAQLIIGRALKLPPEQVALMLCVDLFAAGLATLIQNFGLPGIGIRLPVMMGVTLASVGTDPLHRAGAGWLPPQSLRHKRRATNRQKGLSEFCAGLHRPRAPSGGPHEQSG